MDTTGKLSESYKSYMELAKDLFDRIKNGTVETEEGAKEISARQDDLWDKMSDEEKDYADSTVLMTIIALNSDKQKTRS